MSGVWLQKQEFITNNSYRRIMRMAIVVLSVACALNQSACMYGANEKDANENDASDNDVTVQATYTTFIPLATSTSQNEEPPTSEPNQPDALPVNAGITNPCPEGQFQDLSSNACHALDRPDYGFSVGTFLAGFRPDNVIQANCSESSLKDALEQVGEGGIVQLPACTFSVGRVDLPSNVIIQGAGAGSTTINGSGCGETDSAKSIFNSTGRSNIVFRDMTLDAANQNCVMLSVENSDNVLVERVRVQNSQRTGIKFRRGVNNITIRYSNIFENGEFHGVDSKDCKTGSNIDACPRDTWSARYAVYSNVLRGHGTHGLNIHAINGEIAGNLSYGNGYGGKLYDGQCLWVHHNLISNNDNWGLFIAPTLDIDERISRDLYFYRNTFSGFQNNDHFAWGITREGGDITHPADRITNVYLIDNSYDGRIKTDDITVNVCPATTEWSLSIDNAVQGDDAVCQLSRYASMGGSPIQADQCQ